MGALYGAVQVSGVPRLANQHFLFVGAGQASIGSARLVAKALAEEGLSKEEARKRIWLTDSRVGGEPDAHAASFIALHGNNGAQHRSEQAHPEVVAPGGSW